MSEIRGRKRLLQQVEQEAGLLTERLVVQTQARSRLRKSGYHELHLVSCEFHDGVLTLRGCVSSFHLKQIAQELVRRLDGAEEVNSHLEVVTAVLIAFVLPENLVQGRREPLA